MSSRSRPSQEAVEDEKTANAESLLNRIRNMWQFANFCQWIYIFGKAAKIDESIDIEEIESECLKPNSTLLADIALALLKLISSHRGLTHDIFDAQARKQFATRSPGSNPFGVEDAPKHFAEFDVFTKIIVLQQLTQWTMMHPERVRDHMEEQKDVEQTTWRIEPYGWDSQDRTYYVLDDNRIYRLSQSAPKPTHKTTKSTKAHGSERRSKRRCVSLTGDDSIRNEDAESPHDERIGNGYDTSDGLGGMTWECVAVTLSEVQGLLQTMARTRDENEKILKKQLEAHLVPILGKQEEARKRKELQRERELVNLVKMANAKRSSRIAHKIEQQKLEEKRQQDEEVEATKRREERRRREMEQIRESRLVSREKRLQEREVRRLGHEQQLMQLAADNGEMCAGPGRVSERQLQAQIKRSRQALEDLAAEDNSWTFDCVCGMHGRVDDGTHSVACENCSVWQHSKCLGIDQVVADLPDFHFICTSCSHKRDKAETPSRNPTKIKIHIRAHPTTVNNSTDKAGSEGSDPINGTMPSLDHTRLPIAPSPVASENQQD